MFILFINRNEQPYCDIAILRYCDYFIYHPFNISLSSPQKIFSPFPLSFRKYIVTLPHGGLRHEEQAILICTILQWQHSLLPHPYRRIKPSRNCKMRLHTAEMRPDDMFLDKKIKNPLPSQILSVYLPANKK